MRWRYESALSGPPAPRRQASLAWGVQRTARVQDVTVSGRVLERTTDGTIHHMTCKTRTSDVVTSAARGVEQTRGIPPRTHGQRRVRKETAA